MLTARDLWSLETMLTCLLPLYLSRTSRSSAVHLAIKILGVAMLSAGRISGHTHIVVSMASAVSP